VSLENQSLGSRRLSTSVNRAVCRRAESARGVEWRPPVDMQELVDAFDALQFSEERVTEPKRGVGANQLPNDRGDNDLSPAAAEVTRAALLTRGP
jgi:hypothetical protein